MGTDPFDNRGCPAGQVRSAAAIVPDSLIESLRQDEDSDGLHTIKRNFECGQLVKVIDGAMQGYQAIFYAQSSRDRITVLLNILGRPTRLSLTQQSVESLVS